MNPTLGKKQQKKLNNHPSAITGATYCSTNTKMKFVNPRTGTDEAAKQTHQSITI